MKRTMTAWLATFAFLLMLAAPVQADNHNGSASGGDGSGGNETRSDPESNDSGQQAAQDARHAAGGLAKKACDLVYVRLDFPSLSFDPLLGIIDFDPDECYDIFVETPLYVLHYHYEPEQ